MGSRGDVEPLLGLALALRAQGADVRMCAPPDVAERVAEVGVEFVSLGSAVRELVASRPEPAVVAAALVDQHFDVVGTAAQDGDVVVATGLVPAGVRSVAEHLGIRYVLAGFHSVGFPSLHRRPGPRSGKPFPPGETDLRVLWRIDVDRRGAGRRALPRAAEPAPGRARPAAGVRRPGPRRRRHDDDRRAGGRAAGGRAADRGPAVLGAARGRARHRHGQRGSDADRRAAVAARMLVVPVDG